MKVIWCKELGDLVNIARGQGWLFHLRSLGRNFYYVYVGTEAELLCIAAETREPLKAKYVSIDDDGELKLSDKPIMPTCARITTVNKDESFEQFIRASGE